MKKEPHHWFPKAVNKYQSLTEVTATWLPFLAENPSHFGFQEEVVKKISSSVSDLFWFHFWSWFGAFFYFWVSKECAVPLPQALLAPGGTVGMCSVPLPVSLMPASHIWLNVQSTQTLDFLHDIPWSGVSRLPQIKFCLSWVIRLGWFQ